MIFVAAEQFRLDNQNPRRLRMFSVRQKAKAHSRPLRAQCNFARTLEVPCTPCELWLASPTTLAVSVRKMRTAIRAFAADSGKSGRITDLPTIGTRFALVFQVFRNRIMHQVAQALATKLGHGAGLVRTDGLHAQVQRIRNGCHAAPADQH